MDGAQVLQIQFFGFSASANGSFAVCMLAVITLAVILFRRKGKS
ncbi:hypothetical protein [Mesorhizobium sp. WSM3866]|nr:hypothetical protein [Mesorhizobium sp. WSM3866]